ncbi:MAG: DNA-3-methyladenine glycosylase [Fretibacterium sp.]|nr:DNA-3-methyladenine glycosylase [Fretibacterium sp.]
MTPLPIAFYRRPALTVARELLGKTLVHSEGDGLAGGVIVETEAYVGREDAACHSYGLEEPRPGSRTSVMFRPGGCAYVYLIYGMYHCFNVVSGAAEANSPEAVLVRALEPTLGLEVMRARRKTRDLKKLCSGPGKLCMALNIDRDDNGSDLTGPPLFISSSGQDAPDHRIAVTPRINVSYAGAAASLPYRFVIRDSAFLSTRKGLPRLNQPDPGKRADR